MDPAAWLRTPWPMLALVALLAACDAEPPVTGPNPVPVATVSVAPMRLELPMGASFQLNVMLGDATGNILPDRAPGDTLLMHSSDGQPVAVVGDMKGRTGRIVTWRSDQTAVAIVDGAGNVTGLSLGEASITAESEGQTGVAHVLVTEPSETPLSLVPPRATLSVGESLDLRAAHAEAEGGGTGAAAAFVSWNVDPPRHAMVNAAGRATAIAPGTATVTATVGQRSASAQLQILPADIIHGLDFPGNAGVDSTLRFEFVPPPAAYPATYIWKAYPRQQQSYYTAFFWGNNGAFYPSNIYYGFHPYPDWNTDYRHFWEIATPPGSDVVSSVHVVYDRWYTQVAVCRIAGEETMLEFYWDWPDTTKVVRHRGSRAVDPPEPALIVGDAPWNAGNEVWDGILRGFQFYDAALTPEEIAREIAAPGSVRIPWYLNVNPTPNDIADESENGNDPIWVGSERPALWTGRMTAKGIILVSTS